MDTHLDAHTLLHLSYYPLDNLHPNVSRSPFADDEASRLPPYLDMLLRHDVCRSQSWNVTAVLASCGVTSSFLQNALAYLHQMITQALPRE